MIVTAQQPIVFITDDDASVRDGFEDLLRSVGLGAQSFRSTGEFLQSSRPDLPGCMSDCRGRVDWNFSVHWRKRGSNPSHIHQRHGDIPMSVRTMRLGAIEFLTKPVRSRSCLMR